MSPSRLPRRPGPLRRVPASYGSAQLALPLVTTLPVTATTDTTASLNASVNPRGLVTTTWFAYGPTPTYGSTTSHVSAGNGTIPLAFTSELTGLSTGTTYHVAAVASGPAGTMYGNDVTFVAKVPTVAPTIFTLPAPSSANAVDIPHFGYPFKVYVEGAAVVPQGDLEEVFACVAAIMDCEQGACTEIPGLGRPDETFAQEPVTLAGTLAALETQEGRATQLLSGEPLGSAESGVWQARLTSLVQTNAGGLA